MKTTLVRMTAVAALAAAGILGLSGCGGGDAAAPSEDKGTSTEQSTGGEQSTGEESEAFVADLTEGVKIVNDQIAKVPNMTQIMLASDVDQATQKYGMWVMPYHPSDAVKKFISTIQIDGGKFVVTATSAETGKVWEMDQDGALTEAE